MNTVPDLGGKQRTKTVPPVPYCLMTHVDAPFVKQVLDLPQGERIYNITAKRMISGDVLKYLKWFSILRP